MAVINRAAVVPLFLVVHTLAAALSRVPNRLVCPGCREHFARLARCEFAERVTPLQPKRVI